jgi:NADPH-dependent ferric siderophore reductase
MSTSLRREPPRFRHVELQHVERVSPRLARVTLTGAELDGFSVDAPAASVRLLLPSAGTEQLVTPSWNGNEFLLPDGTRPTIRTFTPVTSGTTLALDVVLHGHGRAAWWAEHAAPGAPVAVSGPGRGYAVDPDAARYLLVGDETALAAVGQLLAAIPTSTTIDVVVEVADAAARIELPAHPRASVEWRVLGAGAPPGDEMARAARDADVTPGDRVWVAGEAAAVQRIRHHLFEEHGFPRARATVRGYWKHGRAGDPDA